MAATGVVVGWTRNLSEGGACVELGERLSPEMLLRLLLRTDRGNVEVEAKVVWAGEAATPGGGFLHGVAFTQVPAEQLRALRDLIRSKGPVRNAGVRLPLVIPVTCKPTGRKGEAFEGLTGDISRGGLLLLLPEVVPTGMPLHVTLHTPKGPLSLEGTVAWVESLGGRAAGPPFRHGFRFSTFQWSTSLSLGLFLAEAA